VDELNFPVFVPASRTSISDILSLTRAACRPDGRTTEHSSEIFDMRLTTTAALLLAFTASTAFAQTSSGSAPEIKWGPAPAVFPAGARMAVLQGDPSSTNLFTVRLRFPDGYRVAAHTHPTDEHVTVVSGTLLVGMGPKLDEKSALTLPAGGFITAPANHAHYAIARGATVVQIHAMGPFALTYVDPADLPRSSASR
jgi:quercetin dioxygenase-like cupin family protein